MSGGGERNIGKEGGRAQQLRPDLGQRISCGVGGFRGKEKPRGGASGGKKLLNPRGGFRIRSGRYWGHPKGFNGRGIIPKSC